MLRMFALAVCGWSLVSVHAASADNDAKPLPKAIAVEPSITAPGQQITLRWYFTGTKVQVSGGRFGKGVAVTGRTSLSDTPTWRRVISRSPSGVGRARAWHQPTEGSALSVRSSVWSDIA